MFCNYAVRSCGTWRKGPCQSSRNVLSISDLELYVAERSTDVCDPVTEGLWNPISSRLNGWTSLVHVCYQYKMKLDAMQPTLVGEDMIIVRRAGLLWSQQDFEWRWSVPLFKCLTVLEFSFILFDLCLLITFFNFIMNYAPIVTFWIFTYHKIWILSIMFCFIWSYWIIYFLACLEVSWRVVS